MRLYSPWRLLAIQQIRQNSFITTPIFYANAAPHLGHLYTAVLADAAHRWEKMKDPQGRHLMSTGTDEHGIKIFRAAEAAGKPPQQFCDEVSERFRRLFTEFDISHTDYVRTTEERHRVAVQEMWTRLESAGHIYKDVYSGWYSVVDECFYGEKEVEDGEIEGRKVKLVKGTRTAVEWVEEDNYMFRLDRFRDQVRDWLEHSDVIRPRHYLPLVLRCLDVEDALSVSRCRRRLPWGIPVPGDDTQTIYVWLDALVNYLTVAGFPNDVTEKGAWPASCHILGKDIMKFHAFYWPSFLLAAGFALPRRLFVHGHWLVDGTKMSKSLGNVVDPFQARDVFTSEGLRYFLLKQGVPHDDSNFTATKALQVINSDLVNNVGNLLSRGTVERLNPDQVYPYLDPISLDEEIKLSAAPLINEINTIAERVGEQYDQMMYYKAIEVVMALVKQGNALFQMHEPWKLQPGPKLSSALYLSYETVRIASVLIQPIVPHFTKHALDRLGVSSDRRGLFTTILGGGEHLGEKARTLGKDCGPFLHRLKEEETRERKGGEREKKRRKKENI